MSRQPEINEAIKRIETGMASSQDAGVLQRYIQRLEARADELPALDAAMLAEDPELAYDTGMVP